MTDEPLTCLCCGTEIHEGEGEYCAQCTYDQHYLAPPAIDEAE